MTSEAPKRYACRVCPRDDLSLTANGRVRSHAANGKRPGPDNPNCPGGSDWPKHDHDYRNAGTSGWVCSVCGETDPRPTAGEILANASGGPNPHRAPLPDHVHRFEYEDDGHDGHNGAFCVVGDCEAEELVLSPDLPHDRNDYQTEDPWQSETPPNQQTAGPLPDRAPGSTPATTEDPWQSATPRPDDPRSTSRPSETATPSSPQTIQATDPVPRSTPTTTATAGTVESRSMKETSSGPTGTVGPTRSASMTETAAPADAFESAAPPVQRAEQQVERDGWGRYKLHHPETGRKQAWQRATTFAKMLEDTFGLGVWQQRMVAKGLSLRPDLLDMVATLEVKRDAEKLNQILEQAKDAAGQKVAANQGTVCHKHTEDVDRGGVPLGDIPVKYRADVLAYITELRRAGITIVPQMIERITVVPDLGVGGTLDRVVMDRFGKYRVLDVKTGNMDFGQLGICIQLALYAHGVNTAGVYDLDNAMWEQSHVPHVETDYALVAHIPVGSGTCELLKVPIDTGWEAVQTAVQVRDWRKVKRLFTAYDPEDVAELVGPSDPRPTEAFPTQVGVPSPGTGSRNPETVAVRPPTWEDRFRAVTSRGEAMKMYAEAEAVLGTGPRLTSLAQIGMAALEEQAG